MGRAPGIDQDDPFACLLQLLRGPGAEHAGADHGHVPGPAVAAGHALFRHKKPLPVAREGSPDCISLSTRQKRLRSVTPMVRGWPVLTPSRARPPRSRPTASRALSANWLRT